MPPKKSEISSLLAPGHPKPVPKKYTVKELRGNLKGKMKGISRMKKEDLLKHYKKLERKSKKESVIEDDY